MKNVSTVETAESKLCPFVLQTILANHFSKERLAKKIGKLPEEKIKELEEKIKILLGL